MATERKGVNRMDFTSEEKELLIAAAESGEFRLVSIQDRTWVTAGGKDFPDDPEKCDLAVIATYLEAFKSIRNRRYIRKVSPIFFRLNVSGFKIARELAEEEQ